jgi:hypothetical protein
LKTNWDDGSRLLLSRILHLISSVLLFFFFLSWFYDRPGGIPARNAQGERLLLFLGVIDILQSYRLKKRLEHTLKSVIIDGVRLFAPLLHPFALLGLWILTLTMPPCPPGFVTIFSPQSISPQL